MTETNYNFIEHPDHYNLYSVECIDMMINIWGAGQQHYGAR